MIISHNHKESIQQAFDFAFPIGYKGWVNIIFILLLLIGVEQRCVAQRTPALNAFKMDDSLKFVNNAVVNATSVVFHPIEQKYYSVRGGLSSYPLETWNAFEVPLFQDIAGFDTRGMWYNPNTGKVERNGYNVLGWSTVELNASGYATQNFNMIFAGMLQPNIQSVAAYDFNTNKVLFYSAGVMSIYDRSTGNLDGTIPLTGTPLTNVNTTTLIYTGELGFEIGLLDYTAKKILLFNRFTGIYSGSSQLPLTSLTNSAFRFSYSNNRVWLFNVTMRTWFSYWIWNEPVPLPVELLYFTARMEKGNSVVKCSWATSSEINNDYFTIERSANGLDFEPLDSIPGMGTTSSANYYHYIDESPLSDVSYYRLKQTDYDGQFSYSKTVPVKFSQKEVLVYYSKAEGGFVVSFTSEPLECPVRFSLNDHTGRVVLSQVMECDPEQTTFKVTNSNLAPGIYLYTLAGTGFNPVSGKLMLK